MTTKITKNSNRNRRIKMAYLKIPVLPHEEIHYYLFIFMNEKTEA